ncbi:MAG TPA: sulfotransferase [Chitinophagaceae bacterium]|jgi:hypothetical protein
MNNKPQIIYIMADNRSGSTLLENILSKSEECFSVGELAMLKGHLLKDGHGEKWNWNCSCGQPLNECVFWGPIIQKIYQPKQENFFTSINWNFKSKALTLNAMFPFVFKKRFLKLINSDNNRQVINTLDALYKMVLEHSGKRIIIDSSKNPIQALAVYKKIKDFDVKIIWLKRDIRAIVTSKSKWKDLNKKKKKSMSKLILNVFYYRRLCYTVSKMVNSSDIININYESLAQHTHEEVQKIIQSFKMKPFETPEYMELAEDHTIGGTPGRFTKKPIQIDESWKGQFENNRIAYVMGGVLNKI